MRVKAATATSNEDRESARSLADRLAAAVIHVDEARDAATEVLAKANRGDPRAKEREREALRSSSESQSRLKQLAMRAVAMLRELARER